MMFLQSGRFNYAATIPPSGDSITAESVAVYNASGGASYSLLDDGSIETNDGAIGYWLDPQTNMDDYTVKATLTSGYINYGITSYHLPMTDTQLWSTSQYNQAIIEIEFFLAGTTNPLRTITIWLIS